ncbi:hypothetical protein H340_07426 [Streptomyces mobaraensis NBRC 13819 = DSM 40847]|uniref:Uncharacterized protein n=2 Tax=Streptomyces mobaraensis TaxID=35621 RepID=M3B5J3_STRM1|nr:hypothetical protein [Streptomyces mobaraensis]EMF01268.1 hypothetical protein H340_07426 [Streptomyces mobaraensis NBRC 13819 = DSM 40847]
MAEDAADGSLPIDIEGIASRTESALALRMDTTTREAMDSVTPAVVGHLNLLLCEELGADNDQEVRELVRKGYTLIDYNNRPTHSTPTFGAFLYLRDVALLTRRLLWIYTERNGLGAP